MNRAVFESLAGHFDLAASTDPSGFQVLALAEGGRDKTSPEFSGFVLGPSGCFIFSCWGEYVRFGAAVTIRCTGEPDLVELPGPALLGAAVHCSGERDDLVLLVSDTLSQKLGQAVGKRCRERLSSFVSLSRRRRVRPANGRVRRALASRRDRRRFGRDRAIGAAQK